jgi:hypothetical protein
MISSAHVLTAVQLYECVRKVVYAANVYVRVVAYIHAGSVQNRACMHLYYLALYIGLSSVSIHVHHHM